MKTFMKIWKRILSSYFWQFLILGLLAFLAFYKIFSFTFHANREMGYLIQLTGGDFSFFNLIKSHGFISFVNYKLFGADPRGWHLTGLLLHIMATWMLVILVNSLTKRRELGFLTGLWFGVSLAWHDVVTFGSHQSMYAAQLFLALLAFLFYKRFREGVYPKRSYFIALAALSATLPLRELGLIFFPILCLFDLIFYYPFDKKKSFKKNFRLGIRFFLPLAPFVIIAFSFFVFFRLSGGVPHYFADERVRLQYKLLAEREYGEYFLSSLASFGWYLSGHIIPYPLVNWLRRIAIRFLPLELIKLSFFPLLGYFYYGVLCFFTFLSRKKKFFPILLFAMAMITVPTFFYSTAISMDKNFFLIDFRYDENRWRYFAFAGTSLFLIVYFSHFFKERLKKKALPLVGALIVGGNLALNTGLLWLEEDKMYQEMFKSQRLFNQTIMKVFPTYHENNVLYAFPISHRLGDFLWEWYNLKDLYYPNLGETRKDWIYVEMEKILKNVKENNFSLDDVFFIDFDLERGVVDYTEEAKEAIFNQKTVRLNYNKFLPPGNKISLPINDISSVEFPYEAEITFKANLGQGPLPVKRLSQEEIEALAIYLKSQMKLKETMKVKEVCETQGKRVVYQPEHLVDGNFGDRSTWWADCLPGWFILDLGKVYNLSGFITGGVKESPLLPLHYYYEVSSDGLDWQKVMEVKENKDEGIMDKWPRPYQARYIKVSVLATQKGSFVMFDEAEPILTEAAAVFDFWTSREELTRASRQLFSLADSKQRQFLINSGLRYAFGKFSWKTNLRNLPEEQTSYYFPFWFDGRYHRYQIPIYESEHYSLHGHFLKRRINQIDLDFSYFPGNIFLESVILRPKIPIKE